VYLSYTEEQLRLRGELRDYFRGLVTPAVEDDLRSPERRIPTTTRLRRRLGADRWLGLGWPAEYGGRGMSATEQFVFSDEAYRVGVPLPFLALNTVGPTLMRFGSESQKRAHLPPIVAGQTDWAIGYSEPDAGTDLASLSTRAVRDGDNYVVNGSKIFTSGADTADYVWLAARTGPAESRHRGISVFIVPTTTPGFRATPLPVLHGGHTTVSFYDDVRVPAANLVLGEGQGWKVITSQLNHERVALATRSGAWAQRAFDDVLGWARRTETESGSRVVDLPWVQLLLARAHALVEAVKLANWRLASSVDSGALTAAESSAGKVLATEAHQEVVRLLLEVLGPGGHLKGPSPGAALRGRLEYEHRSAILYTFGGGNNEVLREIVAWTGLNMPRQAR
jgi:3-oxocholest-4-en-26-oyl-CoA dehydrogenase alpha subunit